MTIRICFFSSMCKDLPATPGATASVVSTSVSSSSGLAIHVPSTHTVANRELMSVAPSSRASVSCLSESARTVRVHATVSESRGHNSIDDSPGTGTSGGGNAPEPTLPSADNVPNRMSSGLLPAPPTVGSRMLHASHRIAHKRGVLICLRCGGYAINLASAKMLRACVQPPNSYGVKTLKR